MFAGKCPGSESRNLTITEVKCPSCGEIEEIFSNELRAKCHKCGNWVYKEQAPTCIDWCAKAKECIGTEKYMELRGFKEQEASAK
ncbi:MAG: phosphohydrolase [Chloroflexi bacterium]|nr:phosphohydrolase [Chloroflexota bacterium]